MTELTSLRNIGTQSARWFESVGIHSSEDLFEIGVVDAYRRVKNAYPNHVSLNMLYALQGALMDLPWNELPSEIKDALKKELETINGLDTS